MKFRQYLYCTFLIFFSGFYGLKAQPPNPCGVIAHIWPDAADSVVPVNTNITFTSTSINATSYHWLFDGLFTGITTSFWNRTITTGVHTISLVAYKDNCSDTVTVVYFSAGTAHNLDSLLLADYGSYNFLEEGTCIDKTPDSGFIAGAFQNIPNPCGEAGIVIKMRNKGCIEWSKKFLSPYYCNYSKITAVHASADTNYYAVTEGFELAKLDKNGNLLWNKKYNLNNQGPISLPNIIGDAQGAIYTTSQAYNNGWTITKLDSNGNVTWNKFFRLSYDPGTGPGQTEFAIPSGMTLLNGKVYVSGNAYSLANSTYFSFITKLDTATGAKEWQYGYTDPAYPGANGFTHLTFYDTLLMASTGAQGQIVTLIDGNGVVKKSIKTHFATSYGPQVSIAGAKNNGHICMMQWTTEPLPLQPYYQYYTNFAEIDTSLNKYWGMVYSDFSRANFADATMGLDNKLVAVGQDHGYVDDGLYSSKDIRFLKIDTAINTSLFCYTLDNNYSISQETINRLNFNYLVDSSLTLTPQAGTPYTVTDAFVQSRYTCPDYIDSCSFMRISGPVNLCSLSDIYTYRMHRNKKCTLLPQWQLPAGVTIINQTDSTLFIKFSGFGIYHISASLYSCIPVKDSLTISIISKSHPLNIGNDTTICSGTSITLHAGNDFISYVWNDSSTDSLLNITQPGIYWVETIDSCNNHLRDSITISPYNQSINIGPDRTMCSSDTIHLDAPSGFLNYSWQPNYYISSVTGQHVIVNPAIDTSYSLKAEKTPGCFAYDTLHVSVIHSPPIDMGADKNFCKGDSAVLNAGTGFSSYFWNTGQLTQQITVYTAGSYSVSGSTLQGCHSYDTLLVNVYPLPVVSLNHTSTLCMEENRVLDAGPGYINYNWNTGASGQSIVITSLGLYSVNVTDSHGCKGTDSVIISKIIPLPSNFLPGDTSICNYGTSQINASGLFNKYTWSTGSSSSFITISKPGWYWLKVQDANNCTGIDSIYVTIKECLKGLFVPSAFTPNNDGKNDVLKPFLLGNVKQYHFQIFNRWGQLIFETTELNKGWNGALSYLQQDSYVFAWVCRYQLEGEPVKMEKGTFVLIR